MSTVPLTHPLTHFKLLSFDVFGTLVDWESGIYNAFVAAGCLDRLPQDDPLRQKENILTAFKKAERDMQERSPSREYAEIVAEAYKRICKEHNLYNDNGGEESLEKASRDFGASFDKWPAFPDTLDALRRLHKHYPYLVPLSNSSPKTYGVTHKSSAGLDNYPFSAAYLASEIGSYKPDLNNFRYLIDHAKSDFRVEKDQILHVAQSQHHDQVPAAKMGLERVWVDRGGVMGVSSEDEDVTFNLHVKSMAELADIVDEAFARASSS